MRHSNRFARIAAALFLLAASTEIASADIVFDFSGTCTAGCTGTATGILTLTDTYTYGTAISGSTFVSFSYTSNDLSLTINQSGLVEFTSGINSDGSLTGELTFVNVIPPVTTFGASPAKFISAD